jgi:TraB/PrgY/gumN family
LSDQYLGRSYDPYLRPIIDASILFQQVVSKSGLITDDAVWLTIKQIARKKDVKIIPVSVDQKVDSPETWIREFAAVPFIQEIDCLEKTIERVETDTDPMRHRANLWSVGDVEALRPLKFPDDRVTCLNVLFSVPRFHRELEEAVAQMYNKWLGLADDALRHNASSVAVLPMSEMLRADGWLDRLRAKGYSIYEP